MRWWSAIVALVVVSSVSSRAQASPRHIDAGGTTLVEAWDRNESGEALAGVVVGVDRRIWKGVAIRSEAHLTHVEQAGPDAWAHGISAGGPVAAHVRPAVRRPRVRLGQRVPRNAPARDDIQLSDLSAAASRFPRARCPLELGARWFHMSKNGREGASRNPDIQSLGMVIAIRAGSSEGR